MTVQVLLIVTAIVFFVLAALGVDVGQADPGRLVAAGLAFFAAAHLPLR